MPRVHVVARGLVIGDDKTRPLVEATALDARCGLMPWRVQTVVVRGLALHIPTRSAGAVAASKPAWTVTVEKIVSEHVQVEILPASNQGTPLRAELLHLEVKGFEAGHAAEFNASILSSQPRAQIEASGHLGPWNAPNPGLTPLDGKYSMPPSNLVALPGIEGYLSSQGQFRGVLERLELSGEANAPALALSISGHPESLHVTFQTMIDATDCSAAIEQLNGTLQQSSFQGQGTVRDLADDRGRDISMSVSMEQGRLEDVIPLMVKSKTSPISGALHMEAKLELGLGEANIIDRLRVNSDFSAPNARFSSLNLREKLRNISRKAAGRPHDSASGSSISSVQGHVQLKKGRARFTNLVFNLEDASAHLTGTYQLATQRLDFQGRLWMAAKLSQTATGMKAFLLKVADPFFRGKHGGSLVPIRIAGTRSDPSFGLDLPNKK
ncbi:MAG: hypothetical protein JOZ32_17600 [Bryobacterales bacterium]|nr:hypothetical protein [Bryobacterales bacterium]